MKNYFKLSMMAIAGAMLINSVSAQGLKIATVDVETLFKEYHLTDVEQKKIAEEFARISLDNDKRMKDLQAVDAQIAKLKKVIEDPTVADTVKKDSAKEAQLKFDELRAMDQERKDFTSRQTKALELQKQSSIQGIREAIREAIVNYSKTEAFDYVFDASGKSQNQMPFLVYAKDSADITAPILAELNKDAPEKKAAE